MSVEQKAVFESLKVFLAKKGFISKEQSELAGFPPSVELAYKSYAENKCGIPYPQPLPNNQASIPVRILTDEDWQFLDQYVEEEAAEDTAEIIDTIIETDVDDESTDTDDDSEDEEDGDDDESDEGNESSEDSESSNEEGPSTGDSNEEDKDKSAEDGSEVKNEE